MVRLRYTSNILYLLNVAYFKDEVTQIVFDFFEKVFGFQRLLNLLIRSL